MTSINIGQVKQDVTKRASSHPQEELRTLKKSNKILKKKAMLHERENARLSRSLKQKDKELEQKDKELEQKDKELEQKDKELEQKDKELEQKDKELEQKDKDLNLERSLWNSRKVDWNSGANTDLHRIEVFDGVISDESDLHSATLRSTREFQHILWHVKAYTTASGKMPLFYEDESRASDPGNRCKLRLRHALLMALIHKKDNLTQGTLQALFGVDQSSVCRYLQVMDQILAEVLPTAKKISEDIVECETDEEFKEIVPGPDGGDVFVDGTHCPVQRPSEKTVRRMRFSGKKKRFTNNTNIYTNADGVIIGISRSSVGSTGDITLLREDPMPFGRWAESMRDDSVPKEARIRIWADRDYQGTGRDLSGATLMIPHKRSKNHRILTAEQKAYNHLVNSTRVRVEHSIGRIKHYARMTDPYDGTIGQFNREFNVITGLVNLHLLWDKIDKGPPPPDMWGTSINWNGTVTPASGAPF